MNHGFDALVLALGYLGVHFLIVLVVAGLATGIDYLAARTGSAGSAGSGIGARAISNLGCASLGLAIAFFAAQGITPSGSNMALNGLATGLTAIVTAGLALFENRDSPAATLLRTGAASFLVTAILSFETFNLQITHIWG